MSGGCDNLIKIWNITAKNLIQLSILKEHSDWIWKIILLDKNHFASCAHDGMVFIWKDNNNNKFKRISTLQHDAPVVSMLHLKKRNVLVTCFGGFLSVINGISFWNLDTCVNEHTLDGYGIDRPTHLIELSDGNIALSSRSTPHPIVIIDSNSYQVITFIHLEEDITCCSSLCMVNEYSFIYVYNGTLIQISSKDYSIMFKTKEGKFNGFFGGIILLEKGTFFVIENNEGISILKILFG